jgi:hypothetical protein
VAACNAESESVQGYTVPLSDALATRVCWIYVDPDCPASEAAFQQWAERNNVHPLVRAFSKFCPADPFEAHGNDPSSTPEAATSYVERAQRCRRTLDLCGSIIAASAQATFETSDLIVPLCAGLIGRSAAAKLGAYIAAWDKCPTLEQVIAAPLNCRVPKQAQFQYAVALCVAGGVASAHARRALVYLARLEKEVGTYAARAVSLRFPDIIRTREWVPFDDATELVTPGRTRVPAEAPLEAAG